MNEFENYQSPFSWRYGRPEMREIWSEAHKRRLWRQIWVALAASQSEFGLVSADQVSELQSHIDDIDIQKALEIEAEIHHDLMAELKTFAAVCPSAGGVLHMGATSMDIEDNADALRLRQAMDLLLVYLKETLLKFSDLINKTANLPIMAFTHIQPAEPSTLGYRLAMYAQDLFEDYQTMQQVRNSIRGKGFKGAVGTAAAYGDLLGMDNFERFEFSLSQKLELPFYPVSTQTYPRKQDYQILSALAGLGASLHKFAFDLRLLQSPPLGEISEPFAKKQVGSSAMPFKRNPINAEKMNSLARQLSVYPQVAWHNAANSLLERTLDDSANRRTMLPESFLICDELLKVTLKLISDLNIHQTAIQRNLDQYAPFACTERVMMAAGKRGADRQEMHECLREHALRAWQEVQHGLTNTLITKLKSDPVILNYLSAEEIDLLSDVNGYVGIAPQRAKEIAEDIQQTLQNLA
jgi:adenylosuccinate lyase